MKEIESVDLSNYSGTDERGDKYANHQFQLNPPSLRVTGFSPGRPHI